LKILRLSKKQSEFQSMKNKKNNKIFTHENQKSFFFDDFLESKKKKKIFK